MIVSSREWSQHQHWWNLRTKWQTKDLDLGPFILRSGALLMELSDTMLSMLWLNQSDRHKNWNIYLVIIWCTYNAHTYTIHMYPPCKKHIHLILIWVFLGFFYTEWKVILINQRTTLLSLMSSTILGFKPSLCSLVRKHSTVPPL